MKKNRFVLKMLAVAIFSWLCLVAQADSNPLVGSWRRSDPGTQQAPASTIVLTFTADCRYKQEMAIPSGFTVTEGIYQITSDSSFTGEIKSSMLCAAGSSCVPNPMPVQYGVKQTGYFQTQGQSQLIIDNVTWTRIN